MGQGMDDDVHGAASACPWRSSPEDVDIRDIAHATAMQCRYNGHVTKFYSVAEHMVHISDAVLRYTNSKVKRSRASFTTAMKPTRAT
jgi:hypothetical protein